jgi:hypothetical protein
MQFKLPLKPKTSNTTKSKTKGRFPLFLVGLNRAKYVDLFLKVHKSEKNL